MFLLYWPLHFWKQAITINHISHGAKSSPDQAERRTKDPREREVVQKQIQMVEKDSNQARTAVKLAMKQQQLF